MKAQKLFASLVVVVFVGTSVVPPAVAAPMAAMTSIGVAGAVKGLVRAVPALAPESAGRVIESGKPLYVNEHVTTGPGGRLQIMLKDETIFTIGPNSDIVLDEFVYNPETEAGKVTASVVKGTFRFITGNIGKKDPSSMEVKLPAGTIGIRGTIVAGQVGGPIMLLGPGPLTGGGAKVGAFSLSNLNPNDAPVLVTKPGFGSTLPGNGAPPTPPALVPLGQANAILSSLAPPTLVERKEEGQQKLAELLVRQAVAGKEGPLVDKDGAPLVGKDGAPLVDKDGAPLVGKDGAPLVGKDGAPLVDKDGAPLVGRDGAPLVGKGGMPLVGKGGMPPAGGMGMMEGRPLSKEEQKIAAKIAANITSGQPLNLNRAEQALVRQGMERGNMSETEKAILGKIVAGESFTPVQQEQMGIMVAGMQMVEAVGGVEKMPLEMRGLARAMMTGTVSPEQQKNVGVAMVGAQMMGVMGGAENMTPEMRVMAGRMMTGTMSPDQQQVMMQRMPTDQKAVMGLVMGAAMAETGMMLASAGIMPQPGMLLPGMPHQHQPGMYQPGMPMVGRDGAPLVGKDGAPLVGRDGAPLVGKDGAPLVGRDGAPLVGKDGAPLVGRDGAPLVGRDGAPLVGKDGMFQPGTMPPGTMPQPGMDMAYHLGGDPLMGGFTGTLAPSPYGGIGDLTGTAPLINTFYIDPGIALTVNYNTYIAPPPGASRSKWEDIRANIVTGTGYFAKPQDVPFNLTVCNGAACTGQVGGTWGRDATIVDFGAKTMSGRVYINSTYADGVGQFSDSRSFNTNFSALAGDAVITLPHAAVTTGAGTAQYTLAIGNQDAVTAAALIGDVTYTNTGTQTVGVGVPLVSPRVGP